VNAKELTDKHLNDADYCKTAMTNNVILFFLNLKLIYRMSSSHSLPKLTWRITG
jgi:hypothetical protein